MTEEYKDKGTVTPPQSRDRRPRLSAKTQPIKAFTSHSKGGDIA